MCDRESLIIITDVSLGFSGYQKESSCTFQATIQI